MNKEKKINIILPFTIMTGGIKVILEYAKKFKEDGYDVVCYVPMVYYKFNYKGIIGLLKRIKASIYNTFIRGSKVEWSDFDIKIKLVPVISDRYIRNADIIIATAWPTAVSINRLNHMKGKKVYFIQGYEVWCGPEEQVKETYRYPMKQVVISKELKRIMNQQFESKNVDVIYNGINLEEFYFDYKDESEIVISTLYHPNKMKGYDEAIKVIEGIKELMPQVKIKVFGTTRPSIIPDYIEFYHNPSREVLRKIYSDSDIFIFCSRNEGWGLTPLEAMACNTVVLGNNDGCIKELGVDNFNCIISDSSRPDEMVNKAIDILNNKSRMNYIKQNALKLASEMNWSASIRKFEEILNKL